MSPNASQTTIYLVVDKDGDPVRRKRSRTVCAYTSLASAERAAKWEGDSVVPLTFDIWKNEPVFIRRKTLDGKP